MYILDHNLEPLPPGTTGEIFIGGDGLARGYLARPGLTAERFIPNPWSHSSNSLADNLSDRQARVYIGPATLGVRTGRSIEFLGRTDQQVKVRGYRIELGEIEAVLHQHPMAREAIVTARRDGDGIDSHRLRRA